METVKTKRLKSFNEFWDECSARLTGCNLLNLDETIFYIFRTDNNAVLMSNVDGFDAAKENANRIRHKLGLKWDQVKFKAQKPFGVSGRTFTNADGQSGRVNYAPRVNPSKGRRFRTWTDKFGNEHDLD
jgi:hypothetical protein